MGRKSLGSGAWSGNLYPYAGSSAYDAQLKCQGTSTHRRTSHRTFFWSWLPLSSLCFAGWCYYHQKCVVMWLGHYWCQSSGTRRHHHLKGLSASSQSGTLPQVRLTSSALETHGATSLYRHRLILVQFLRLTFDDISPRNHHHRYLSQHLF